MKKNTWVWIIVWILSIILAIKADECHAQSKNDIIIYSLQFISGAADGVNQAVVYHHLGRGNHFWDYTTSSNNKYRDFPIDKRAAFPLSKTVLVTFTDGNHLTRGINRSCQLLSLGFALGDRDKKKLTFKQIAKKVLISAISNRVGFVLFYNVIYRKNY